MLKTDLDVVVLAVVVRLHVQVQDGEPHLAAGVTGDDPGADGVVAVRLRVVGGDDAALGSRQRTAAPCR